uniref:Plasmid conjugative transfer entry exclusion protein TraS n=1 Tax=Ackermannviridae sp. ctaCq7 TaxID=2827294 RepID=A0A8S5R668_9CAUD|nr:MAG TPA: Plasmid conjugative transfer entry exclusion protein TraS [Ackermannviridae sp. ctaCq7]
MNSKLQILYITFISTGVILCTVMLRQVLYIYVFIKI